MPIDSFRYEEETQRASAAVNWVHVLNSIFGSHSPFSLYSFPRAITHYAGLDVTADAGSLDGRGQRRWVGVLVTSTTYAK